MAPVNRVAGFWSGPRLSDTPIRSPRPSLGPQLDRPESSSRFAARARNRQVVEAPKRQVDETHRLAGPVATLAGAATLAVSGIATSICGLAFWAGYLASPHAALGLAACGAVTALAATLIGYGALVSVAVASSQLD